MRTNDQGKTLLLHEMEKRFGDDITRTWFSHVQVDETTGRIIVPVFNIFYREWVESNYAQPLRELAEKALGAPVSLIFEVRHDLPAANLPNPGMEHAESPDAAIAESAAVATDAARNIGIALSPHYSFDAFVVGSCNRLAHAAAMAVSESPGRAYNPLFLHGGVGLGKTHLLQAICHSLLARNREMKILYLPCDTFINHFITGIRKGNLEEFRHKYRYLDVLLIDDIHFLAGKDSTQDELFHTFNTLYNAQKQIILSSDSPPGDIPTLQDRLVSRFKWGLVARLDPPDFETRMAIVKKKSRLKGCDLSDKVCDFIAHHFVDNIRVLEGAINRIIGYAALHSRPIDLPFAMEALRDIIEEPQESFIDIDDIQRLVCNRFSIKLSDLQSKKRTKSVAFPRQVCMYLARTLTKYSLEEVGGFFGGRDHTTVMYAEEKIKELRETDPQFNSLVETLVSKLREKQVPP